MSFPRLSKTIAQICLLFVVYFLAAKLGISISEVSGFATLVWAPSGIALAALYLCGTRVWPGVLLGALLFNWSLGASLYAASGIAIGNTLEAVIGATLLRRSGFSPTFERLRDVYSFLFFAALFSTLVSAVIGVTSLVSAGAIPADSWRATLQAWWLGDIMGDLIVAPLFLVWSHGMPSTGDRRRVLEIFGIVGVLVICSIVILGDVLFKDSVAFPRPYFLFPILMIVAFRWGQRGLVTANFWISAVAIALTARGQGRFWVGNINDSILILQVFLGILITSKLVLAAVISERRRERLELKKITAQREAIFDAALDCIVTVDLEGRVVEFNPAAQKVFGYQLSEVLGKDMALLLVPPRFRAAHYAGIERFQKTGKGPVLGQRLEIPAMRADGSEFLAEVSIHALHTSGIPLFTGFIQDITQRKRAEESERFLAEVTEVLSASIDYGQTIRHVAFSVVPRYADWCVVHIFGENGAVEMIESACSLPEKEISLHELTSNYLSVVEPPTVLAEVARIKKTVALENTDHEVYRRISKDQRHFELLCQLDFRSLVVSPLMIKGRVIGAITLSSQSGRVSRNDVALFEELAHRAATAVENARLYREAREAILARDEFLSIASHELKTPLTALSLQLQMFSRKVRKAVAAQSEGKDGDERAEIKLPLQIANLVVSSEQQSQKLARLLDELLDLTRIRMGKLQLEKEIVDLSVVVHEVAERFKTEAAQKGIQVSVQADAALEGNWDRMRVEQVVNNLISNAFKYGEGNPVAIQTSKTADGRASLVVRDEGMGIPPEMQALIFERFERAGLTGQKIAGLGLGLYICRQIVDAHGGEIHVDSQPGRGATFTVILPLNAMGRGTRLAKNAEGDILSESSDASLTTVFVSEDAAGISARNGSS